MLTFVAVQLAAWRIHNNTRHRPGGKRTLQPGWQEREQWRRRDKYAMMFTKYHWVGEALGRDSIVWVQSLFFSNQAKIRQSGQSLSVAYLDLVLHLRFKTKRSLRSDADRSTDKVHAR